VVETIAHVGGQVEKDGIGVRLTNAAGRCHAEVVRHLVVGKTPPEIRDAPVINELE
jgi:hypothetical protein